MKNTQTSDSSVDWRCRECGFLLAVRELGRVFIKIKDSRYAVQGDVTATCPRCHEVNEHAASPARSNA